MGADSSKVDPSKMPEYYIPDARISAVSCGLLERSLRNIVGRIHNNKNTRIYFLKFYETFYNKLDEIQQPECTLTDYIDKDMETKSLFLVKLLKLVVLIPQSFLNRSNQDKIDNKTRKELKRFCKEFYEVKLECYGKLGEALFYSMQVCDEMYKEYITQAWITGYSVFLKHYIPLAIKTRQRKARHSKNHLSTLDENSYDMSSDTCSSDGSSLDQTDDEDERNRSASKQRLVVQIHKRRFKRNSRDHEPFDKSHSPSVTLRRQLKDIWDITDNDMKANDISSPTRRTRCHSWDEKRKGENDLNVRLAPLPFKGSPMRPRLSKHGEMARHVILKHEPRLPRKRFRPERVRPYAVEAKRRQLSWSMSRKSGRAARDMRINIALARRHSCPAILWKSDKWAEEWAEE